MSQPKQNDSHTHKLVDRHTGQTVGYYTSKARARAARDRKDNEYGGYRYSVHAIERTPLNLAIEAVWNAVEADAN